jgi:hypothetical protein
LVFARGEALAWRQTHHGDDGSQVEWMEQVTDEQYRA